MTATTNARKTATDSEVFDLNLNAVKAEKECRPFRFLWGPDNKRFEMAHQQTLDQLPIMEAYTRSEVHGLLATLRQALGDQWAEFRKIPLNDRQRDALMEGYAAHCGIDLGELSASNS